MYIYIHYPYMNICISWANSSFRKILTELNVKHYILIYIKSFPQYVIWRNQARFLIHRLSNLRM